MNQILYSAPSRSLLGGSPENSIIMTSDKIKKHLGIFLSSKSLATITWLFILQISVAIKGDILPNKPNGFKIRLLLYRLWQIQRQLLNLRIAKNESLSHQLRLLTQYIEKLWALSPCITLDSFFPWHPNYRPTCWIRGLLVELILFSFHLLFYSALLLSTLFHSFTMTQSAACRGL